MKISGSGSIPGGDYNEEIRISGSGRIIDNVRCTSFSCSGSGHVGGNLVCSENIKISGSCSINGNVEANSFSVSGSGHIGGSLTVGDSVSASGSFRIDRSINCKKFESYGSTKSGADVTAEEAIIKGSFRCQGLLNAEKIEIVFDPSGEVGSIGGSAISIYPQKFKKGAGSVMRLPLISKILGSAASSFTVHESIEGDVIAIEGVAAPSVTGRIVAIGAGCNIKSVRYIEQCEIDPSANVESCEKI